MTDTLDATGLSIKALQTLITELENGFKGIYGEDINVAQNSPDGQIINITAQLGIDLRELLQSVYNGFDPDVAQGSVLDSRVAINNIQRKGGTFTTQPVTLTLDRTVDLQGLDANFSDVNATGYTVQDDSGNQFILIDSGTFTAGDHTLNFRARNIGRVETTVGTITTPVTIVLGVTAINNASGALELGQDQETDAQLRTRRTFSTALGSQGYLNGLLGAVLNLDGVTEAVVYENFTSTTDSDGIPPHSIWLIVEGGANTDIANELYERKTAGAGMRGSVSVDITTPSNAIFTAQFDRPTAEDLHIRFDIQETVAGTIFDQTSIKQYIVDNLTYKIGQAADTSQVTCIAVDAINNNGGGGVPVNVEISRNGADFFDFLAVSDLDNQFTLDVSRITITEL